MPQLPIADKTTLDLVNTKVGATGDAANALGSIFARLAEILTNRLTAARAAFLDVAVSSRAPASTALSTATWTAARATNLDKLDIPVSLASNWGSIESDTIQLSADGECYTTNTSYVKAKEFRIKYGGRIRVKFETKSSVTNITTYIEVRRNGTAVNNNNTGLTNYTQFSIDLDVTPGDCIQVYQRISGVATSYLRNVRICYDITQESIPTVLQNSAGAI
ncbi:MAG: hypothetical protein JL50_10065 [Peptococcaceae bacterium BICA1-7]|nr:MAG: hypothetical protein JL50_10065 [Peptococcaceae bacterium BICA1-7]HBV95628.1 hypothetical protein [Desulfotomaculum sp.]